MFPIPDRRSSYPPRLSVSPTLDDRRPVRPTPRPSPAHENRVDTVRTRQAEAEPGPARGTGPKTVGQHAAGTSLGPLHATCSGSGPRDAGRTLRSARSPARGVAPPAFRRSPLALRSATRPSRSPTRRPLTRTAAGDGGTLSPAGPSPLAAAAAAAASERYLRIAKLNVSADGGHTYVPDIRPPSTVPVYEQSPMPGRCSFRAENSSPDTTASTAPVSIRLSAVAQEPPTFR